MMKHLIHSIYILLSIYKIQIVAIHFITNEKDAFQRSNTSVIFDCSVDEWSKENIVSIRWLRGYNLISLLNRFPKEKYLQEKTVLVLNKVKPKDAGRYQCKIKTTKGILNRTFDIPPTKVPYIVKHRTTHRVVNTNEDVKFKCLVSPYFTTSYTWLFQGKIMKPQSGISDFKIKKYQFLRIRRVSLKDQGIYTCSVTNAIGRSEINYYLVVKGNENATLDLAPQLKNNVSAMLVEIVMNNLKLDCRSTGKPPFNVTWLKNGKPITTRGNGGKYSYQSDSQILLLKELLPGDSGVYTCIVKNKYGSYRHNMEVDPIEKVAKKPIFLFKEKSEAGKAFPAVLGQNLTVFAHIVLFGTTHFQMLKHVQNNTEPALLVLQTPREHFDIQNEERDEGAANERRIEFYFINVSKKDLGNYTIMAGNTLGYDVYPFHIAESTNEVGTSTSPQLKTKDNLKTSSMLIIIISCVLIIILVSTAILIMKYLKAKKKSGSGNPLECKKEIEAVILNISPNTYATRLSSSSVGKRVYNSARLSSCQTEKEYFMIPFDDEWEVDFDNIELKRVLGEGAFGRVMLADVHGLQKSPNLQTVAVKMLKEKATDQELKDLLSEIEVMKTFGKHTNIINILGVSSQSGELCLIMEYCSYGNLRVFLKQRRPVISPHNHGFEELTLVHLTSFCLQVAKGMDYLASKKCIHRDIAARNVLVADGYILKLADFGLARDVHERDYYRKCTDGRLPVKWMAIEALFDRVYTVQSDIWSFGILIWEIITFGGSPYPGIPIERLFDLLEQGYRMEQPINCTDEMYLLMLNCWKELPKLRPTFSSIVECLEAMLIDLGTSDYMELQPPLSCTFPTESTSSTPPASPLSLTGSHQSVFDDVVQPTEAITEKCKLLVDEDGNTTGSYTDLDTKL